MTAHTVISPKWAQSLFACNLLKNTGEIMHECEFTYSDVKFHNAGQPEKRTRGRAYKQEITVYRMIYSGP